jgi:hypothetical protein
MLSCLLFFNQSHAETSNNVKFSVKPLACIVKTIGDSCKMTVKIKWDSSNPITSCLFQDKIKMVCWHNRHKAQEHIEITIKEDMEFTLMNEKNDVYAKQSVRINTSKPKSFRRRLRSDWSLF